MSKLGRIFFTGMFISFLGSLPLGTLNIAVMQISISDGIGEASLFALGSLLPVSNYFCHCSNQHPTNLMTARLSSPYFSMQLPGKLIVSSHKLKGERDDRFL